MPIKTSPFFFLLNSTISEDLPESKKAMKTAPPAVWVSRQSFDTKKLKKWTRTVGAAFDESFYDGIAADEDYTFAKSLPDQLSRRLFSKGTIAVDTEGRLPIRSNAIVYQGKDEKLRKRLSDYVTVFDRLQVEELPIVLDKRDGFDGKLFGNEIIIDFAETAGSTENSSILVPRRFENDEIIISKMLFGALSVSGRSQTDGVQKLEEQGVSGLFNPRIRRAEGRN